MAAAYGVNTDETTNFIYDSASQLSYEVIDENTLDYMHYIYQIR